MNTTTKVVLVTAMAAAAIAAFLGALQGFKAEEGQHPVELLHLDGVTGPESLAFDADGGGPYTGVSDGRILKWEPAQRRWTDFAASPGHMSNECRGTQDPKLEHLCGRPLGLTFNKKSGDLYIADAYLGLLKIGPNETTGTRIISEDHSFHFTNGLDIKEDSGVIYFTSSSNRFQRREFMSAIISGDKSGRMVMYDQKRKKFEVLLDGLSFPNGLTISHDESFILIAETTTCRVLKYYLRTPTSFEVFAQLPGYPDNIKRSPRGGYWVALHSRRSGLLKRFLSFPWLAELLLRIPIDVQRFASFISSWRGQALAVRLSEEGEVLEVLEGLGGRMIKFLSEVEEYNGTLWFGSVVLPFVGLYKL